MDVMPVSSNPWPADGERGSDRVGESWDGGDSLPWIDLDDRDVIQMIRDLKGRTCRIGRRGEDWIVTLTEGRRIVSAVPWRLVDGNRIVLGSVDEGRLFGLHEPVDCAREAQAMIENRTIDHVAICTYTADLTLMLTDGLRIDLFNHSSGTEGWRIRCRIRDRWATVIGSGGGHVRASLDATGFRLARLA
jgi:hypothetical protein